MGKLRVLSLFAGIGGFDLGLERTGGFETVAFCEFDKKAQRVLTKHWPEVPIYDDVRTLTAERLAADGVAVDCIVGGFPCQDISKAGDGAGIDGQRSGLWAHYARLIGELRPRVVIVENVSALLSRGLGRVLGDLAALGHDADWHCIPASAVGAPHQRDRIWIVAYPRSDGNGADDRSGQDCGTSGPDHRQGDQRQRLRAVAGGSREVVADAKSDTFRARLRQAGQVGNGHQLGDRRGAVSYPDSTRLEGWLRTQVSGGRAAARHAGAGGWWGAEPAVGRVAYGVPGRVDRLKQLGNSVIPQIPELIGNAILASMQEAA